MGKSQKPRKAYKPAPKDDDHPDSNSGLQVFSQQFSGPLPPPGMLEHYEKIHPGFTAHLLEENRLEREHRQRMEDKVARNSKISSLLGIAAGILVVAAFIGLVYYALASGNGNHIGSIIGFPMVALVGVFITRKYFQQKEKE